jgi:hypothetical protein
MVSLMAGQVDYPATLGCRTHGWCANYEPLQVHMRTSSQDCRWTHAMMKKS